MTVASRRLFFICALLPFVATAQQRIEGRLGTAAGEGLAGATVRVLTDPQGKLLTFGISRADGSFSVEVPASDADSVWLSVAHLNYETEARWVDPAQFPEQITLYDRIHELPMTTVTHEAVTQHRDTLVFDANQLREAGDETVEQLLSRIPGMSVEEDGTILYEGLEISKFYIEGLDLLEGRYAIATRNLRSEVIRDVEVLQRHQPIRALDSLEIPPNAAINLRLKSDVALTGNATAGGGAPPLPLYVLEGSLFGFTKQQQFSLLGSLNNIGTRMGENFRDLTRSKIDGIPLVRATTVLRPLGVDSRNYLDNREGSGGFNFLRRLGEQTELKVHGFATHNETCERGSRRSILEGPDSAVTFLETLDALIDPLTLASGLSFTVNRERLYLNSQFWVSHQTTSAAADNTFNAAPTRERYLEENTELEGKLAGIVRSGDRAQRLDGRIKYTDRTHDLTLFPAVLIVPDFPDVALDTGRQIVRLRELESDLFTDFLYRKDRLRGAAKLGLRTDYRTLTSDLRDSRDFSLGESFVNDNARRVVAPYADQEFSYDTRQGDWKLYLPLSVDFARFADARSENVDRAFLVAQPELSYNHRLPRQRLLSLIYRYDLDYLDGEEIFTGYLIRQNRFLNRRLPAFNRGREHRLTLKFQGRKLESATAYSSSLQLQRTTRDLLAANTFNGNGQAKDQLSRSNTRRSLRLTNSLDFRLLRCIITKLTTNYTLTSLPLFLNDRPTELGLHQLEFFTDLTYVRDNSALGVAPRLTYLSNSLNDPVSQVNVEVSYYRELPAKWGNLRLSSNWQRVMTGERSVSNILLNFHYQRPVIGDKFRLRVSLYNLTNAGSFVTFTQQSFSEELSFYRLLERRLIVTIGKAI